MRDGEWITPNDTTLSLFATGIVCGSLSVDTMSANVGETLEFPIRFESRFSQRFMPEELIDAMNLANARNIEIRIQYDSTLLRIRRVTPNRGVLGSVSAGSFVFNPSNTVLSTNASPLTRDNVLALLQADVLLSQKTFTPITVSIDSFASGFSAIVPSNGLLRASYCALDKRQVNTDGLELLLRVDENNDETVATIYSAQNLEARVELFDVTGEQIAEIFSGVLSRGTTTLPLYRPSGSRGRVGVVRVVTRNGSVAELFMR